MDPINIDITKPDTWPVGVSEIAERYEVGEFPSDLQIHPSDLSKFGKIMNGRRILARHATRLLNSEVARISINGLEVLTEELVAKKISDAVKAHQVKPIVAQKLLEGNIFKTERIQGRENLVCAVIDERDLPNSRERLDHQLREWGGECIGFTEAGKEYQSILRNIGKPTVVSFWVKVSWLLEGWDLENILRQCICEFHQRKYVTSLHIEGLKMEASDIEEIYQLTI